MLSLVALQNQQKLSYGDYDSFELYMTQNHPKSIGDISGYILIQLSKCREGGENHKKWSKLYDTWSDSIGNKSRTNTALSNYNLRALAQI